VFVFIFSLNPSKNGHPVRSGLHGIDSSAKFQRARDAK